MLLLRKQTNVWHVKSLCTKFISFIKVIKLMMKEIKDKCKTYEIWDRSEKWFFLSSNILMKSKTRIFNFSFIYETTIFIVINYHKIHISLEVKQLDHKMNFVKFFVMIIWYNSKNLFSSCELFILIWNLKILVIQILI